MNALAAGRSTMTGRSPTPQGRPGGRRGGIVEWVPRPQRRLLPVRPAEEIPPHPWASLAPCTFSGQPRKKGMSPGKTPRRQAAEESPGVEGAGTVAQGVGRELGVSKQRAHQLVQTSGQATPRPHAVPTPRTEAEDSLVLPLLAEEAAARTRRTLDAVYCRRHVLARTDGQDPPPGWGRILSSFQADLVLIDEQTGKQGGKGMARRDRSSAACVRGPPRPNQQAVRVTWKKQDRDRLSEREQGRNTPVETRRWKRDHSDLSTSCRGDAVWTDASGFLG
jgi:hypothetical protein